MTNQAAQAMPLPPSLPEWSRMDDLGGVVPSEVRQALIAMYQQGYAAALSQTAGVPDGWKLVPVEPTAAMCDAMRISVGDGIAMKPVYRAMLAAAPAACTCTERCAHLKEFTRIERIKRIWRIHR